MYVLETWNLFSSLRKGDKSQINADYFNDRDDTYSSSSYIELLRKEWQELDLV